MNPLSDTLPFFQARPEQYWSVVQSRFSVKHNRHYEALFTIGSGYLNIRGSLPEGLTDDPQNISFSRAAGNVTLETFRSSKSKWGTYVPGFMDQHPALNEEMVNLPFPLGLTVFADREKLDMERSTITRYKRWIDLRDGCLHRSCVWHTGNGAEIQLAFHAYVHLVRQQLVWQNLSITVQKGQARLTVVSTLDGDVRTNGFDHTARTAVWGSPSGICGLQAELHNGARAVVSSRLFGLSRWQLKKESRRVSLSGSKLLREGQFLELIKITSVATSLDADTPRRHAMRALRSAVKKSSSALYAEHRQAWDQVWRDADLRITGDPESTLALRFSIYHLVRSNPRNPRAAIDAKMNGGDAYWGRIHWDNEIFIAPFFIYTLPDWARPLLEYRYRTLPGAQRRARELGYPGAMFAWESGSSGDEQCPSFQYADHEIHISADVVLGLWHYACATNDLDFLVFRAADVIFNVARFWAARIDWLPGSLEAHILCVMGPDEYAHAADDNAYTNYLVYCALVIAGQLYAAAEKNSDIRNLIADLKITPDEARAWRTSADALSIPFDPERNLLLQSADFEDSVPLDFDSVWPDRSWPLGQFLSQERLYRSRALKQADVLMLMQLFISDFPDAMIQTALAYYEPLTTHDSSLSVSTHAIIAARLGLVDKAWNYFVQARSIDLAAGSHNAAEGVHSANAGALWQTVVFGFLGMLPAYLTDTLTFEPRLPHSWQRCECTIVWHATRVKVRVEPGRTVLSPDAAIRACVAGQTKTCPAGRDTFF